MHGVEKHIGALPPEEKPVEKFASYEDAAIAAKAAWDAGDYDAAAEARRAAAAFVAEKAKVVQMPDGALQLVPLS